MITNAQITHATLSMRDHGVLTYGLGLKLARGGFCEYGGYCIGHGYLDADEFEATGDGLEAIMRIMDTVGVERWEDLTDKYIRVEDEGLGRPINKIGNIIKEKWFDQDEFFRMKQKQWGGE